MTATDRQRRKSAVTTLCECGDRIILGNLEDVVGHVLLRHPEKFPAVREMLNEMGALAKTPAGRRELAKRYPELAGWATR